MAIAIWTCGEILLVPRAAAFMAEHAPAGRGSTFQGAYAFVWTLGLAVGAPAGQLLLATAGTTPLWSGARCCSAYASRRAEVGAGSAAR